MDTKYFIIPYIQRCKLLYTRLIGKVGKVYGLSQTACDVLIFLHNHPQYTTATDVVTHRMIAKSNVSTAVEELKKKGYATASPDPENRRITHIHLTEEALPVAQDIAQAQGQFSALLETDIPKSQWEHLQILLEKTDKNIQKALLDLEKGDI